MGEGCYAKIVDVETQTFFKSDSYVDIVVLFSAFNKYDADNCESQPSKLDTRYIVRELPPHLNQEQVAHIVMSEFPHKLL